MPCYKPLKRWLLGTKPNGKKDITFKREEALQEGKYFNEIEIPCGQCIGCRLDYAKNWAVRCILESKEHDENYFVTLTYKPEYLPTNIRLVINEQTGERQEQISHTLFKKDVQDFIKRIREDQKYKGFENIRFYMCGEYGNFEEHTGHPHYHIIFFGLHLDDLKPFFINANKQQVYRSEYLEKKWYKTSDEEKKTLGYVSVGEVNYETAAYTARYILKKQKGEMREFYETMNILPEYTEMSLKPGIGANYLKNHSYEIYENDEIIVKMRGNKPVSVKPPKYFDSIAEKLEGKEWEDGTIFDIPKSITDVKTERTEKAINTRQVLRMQTTLSREQQLEKNLRHKEEQVKRLKRKIKNIL